MTSTEVLNSKNKIHDRIKLITDFKALWEQDLETKRFKFYGKRYGTKRINYCW